MTRLEKIEKAQELLHRVIELVDDAVEDLPCQENVQAYFVDQMKTYVQEDHGYLCSNLNLDKIKVMVENDDEENDASSSSSEDDEDLDEEDDSLSSDNEED